MISIKKGALSLCIFFTAHSMPMGRAKEIEGILNSIASTARCHEIKTLKVLPSFAKEYGVAAILVVDLIATAYAGYEYKHNTNKISKLLVSMTLIQLLYLALLFNPLNSPSWVLAAVYLADHITRCIYINQQNGRMFALGYAIPNIVYNIVYYFFRDLENVILSKIAFIIFCLSHASGIAVSYSMVKAKTVAPLAAPGNVALLVLKSLLGKELTEAEKNLGEVDLEKKIMEEIDLKRESQINAHLQDLLKLFGVRLIEDEKNLGGADLVKAIRDHISTLIDENMCHTQKGAAQKQLFALLLSDADSETIKSISGLGQSISDLDISDLQTCLDHISKSIRDKGIDALEAQQKAELTGLFGALNDASGKTEVKEIMPEIEVLYENFKQIISEQLGKVSKDNKEAFDAIKAAKKSYISFISKTSEKVDKIVEFLRRDDLQKTIKDENSEILDELSELQTQISAYTAEKLELMGKIDAFDGDTEKTQDSYKAFFTELKRLVTPVAEDAPAL